MNQTESSRRFHIVIDAFNCEPALLSDKNFLNQLVKEIAALIRMNILKGPIAEKGIPQNPGLSVFAIIDFSHIAIHTFTDSGEFCLDVFSCKRFNYLKLYDFIKEKFKLENTQINRAVVKYNNLPNLK